MSMSRGILSSLMQPFTRSAAEQPGGSMSDGWVIDQSQSLPHLERLMRDLDELLAQDSGLLAHDLLPQGSAPAVASLSAFAASGECKTVVRSVFGSAPSFISGRCVRGEAASHGDRHQQRYRVCRGEPAAVVIVALADIAFENGPWTFLPRSYTQQVVRSLGLRRCGASAGVSDDEVYAIVDRCDAIEFAYPRGSVLVLNAASCLHFSGRITARSGAHAVLRFAGTNGNERDRFERVADAAR